MLQRVSEFRGRLNLLHEQRSAAILKHDEVANAINVAEAAKPAFKLLKDQVEVGATTLYGELLTSIVHDVMADYNQRIELETDVVRGKTTLNINSYKQGHKEPIDDARGGSINNLLAAGLRFISLIQSCNRRFVLLDEAECWLESHLIPRFVHVVERLCEQTGIQCLMISHHASDVISSDRSKVVTLERARGKLVARTQKTHSLSDFLTAPGDLDTQYTEFASGSGAGISQITLCNVQSHSSTTIPLGPGLTVINGGNDIGKSAIARALKALLTNTFRDDLISHKADDLQVSLTLEGQCQLIWKFLRKGKASLYQYADASGKVLQEEEATIEVVPPFVHEVLAMPPVNDIDVHIADQKDPLFILHPSIAPYRRAELLNLGDEFRQLQLMMSVHESDLRDNRRQLRAITTQVNQLNDAISKLSPVELISEALNATDSLANEMDAAKCEHAIAELWSLDNSAAIAALNAVDYADDEPEHSDIIDQLFGSIPDGNILASVNDAISGILRLRQLSEHNGIYSDLCADSVLIANYTSALNLLSLVTNHVQRLEPITIPKEFSELHSLISDRAIANSELAALLEQEKALRLQNESHFCKTCGQSIPNPGHIQHTHGATFSANAVRVAEPVKHLSRQEKLNAVNW